MAGWEGDNLQAAIANWADAYTGDDIPDHQRAEALARVVSVLTPAGEQTVLDLAGVVQAYHDEAAEREKKGIKKWRYYSARYYKAIKRALRTTRERKCDV